MTASYSHLDSRLDSPAARASNLRREPHIPLAELRRTARRYALNPNLSALLPEGEGRTWARLAGDARLDVWVISWPEGTETGWHDHGDASGAFAIASGVVLEQTWALGTVQQRTLSEGDTRAFGRDHVHNVIGAGRGRSITVHAYAPGLVEMGRFELGPAGPARLSVVDDGTAW